MSEQKRYDYIVTEVNMTASADESFLASLGESGWELVAVSDRRMYLKKVVDRQQSEGTAK